MSDAVSRVLSGKSWEDFCDGLKAAGQTILRPETPATEIDRAEGFRYLSRLTRAALERMVEFADPDFPVFYALSHETIKIGSDNPDNTYRNCIVDGTKEYRVTGNRGTAPVMTFGTKAERYAIDGTQASTGELDSKNMAIAPDGSFEIVLSAKPQPGNWLPLAPDSSMLIVRETHFDRKSEVPGRMTIEQTGGPAKPSPLTAAQFMLLIDRYLGGHFFDTQAGGSATLWMHFFWIFGHPEVYVLIMPAFGIASEVIPVFSRKAIFGYPAMVAASVSIAFISLGVWAHHMFTMGMSAAGNAFFALSTMIVGIPTGIKIFNWLATLWGGKIRFAVPMLFAIAFLFQFLIAGLTGIMLSVAPFDWQLHNSYFVVAHFHYVIVGAILMMVFCGFYYWYPKVTGRMLDERLGKLHFWLFVIGFHVTFDTMHIPGLLGMPRQIYTYEADRGWGTMNLIVTIGAFIQAIAIVIFVLNLIVSLFRGKIAGPDPWDAWTLEWTTASPPHAYNFDEEPVVSSARPLWDLKHQDDPD